MSIQSRTVGALVFISAAETNLAWHKYLEGLKVSSESKNNVVAVCRGPEIFVEDAIALATPYGLFTVKEKYFTYDELALIKKVIDEEYPLAEPTA